MVECTSASACLASCPGIVKFFVLIGGLVVYAVLAYIVYLLLKAILKKMTDNAMIIVMAVLFPIAIPILIAYAILYWVILWLMFPFIGATKVDLQKTEDRINHKIDSQCGAKTSVKKEDCEIVEEEEAPVQAVRKLKAGDLITASSNQTDRDGEPANYKHLGQGCVCKVKSNDANGNMQVILIDHKDRAAHEEKLYTEFKAPARNFKLYVAPRVATRSVRKKQKASRSAKRRNNK